MLTEQQKQERRKYGSSSECAAVWHLINGSNLAEDRIDPHKDGCDVYWNKVVRMVRPDGTSGHILPYAQALDVTGPTGKCPREGWSWEPMDKDKPISDQMMEGILLEDGYLKLAEHYTGLTFEPHRMFCHPNGIMAANTDAVCLDTAAGVFHVCEIKRIGDPRILAGYGNSNAYDAVHNCHWFQVHHQACVLAAATGLKPGRLLILADRIMPKHCPAECGIGIGLYRIRPDAEVWHNIEVMWGRFFSEYVNKLVAPPKANGALKKEETVAA